MLRAPCRALGTLTAGINRLGNPSRVLCRYYSNSDNGSPGKMITMALGRCALVSLEGLFLTQRDAYTQSVPFACQGDCVLLVHAPTNFAAEMALLLIPPHTIKKASQNIDIGQLVAFYASHHVVPLPADHRFPMEKYAATLGNLANDASLEDKIDLRPGPLADLRDLLLVHDEEYIHRFSNNRMTAEEMKNVGFPWSTELGRGEDHVSKRKLGRLPKAHLPAVAQHISVDLQKWIFATACSKTCVFGLLYLQRHCMRCTVAMRDYGVERILVVDLDVHQGNGTAAIFEDDPRVTTFDVFGDKNYPWKTRMRNTYDVPLPDGTEDEAYLGMLRQWLPHLISQHQPQLLLFQAGVDALKGDSFGRLSLSRQGLLQRNHLVYTTALQHCIPMVITMGGGYTKPMDASIECHTDVFRTAAYRLNAWAKQRGGAAFRQAL